MLRPPSRRHERSLDATRQRPPRRLPVRTLRRRCPCGRRYARVLRRARQRPGHHPENRQMSALLKAALPALVLGCTRFGATVDLAAAAPAATDGGPPSSCRDSLFDPFADGNFGGRWDSIVQINSQLSVDPSTSVSPPQSLRVTRSSGGGSATLTKQLPRST